MRPMTIFAMLSAATAWAGFRPAAVRAQDLEPGTRVRATYECVITVARTGRRESCRRVEGLLIARDSLGLTLATSIRGAPVRLTLPAISRVEIVVGWRGHPTQGAVLGGFALGILTALGTDAVLNAAYCDAPRCHHSAFAMLWGFLPGFGLGAAIGQAVGGAVISERWQEVPRERLTPGPGRSRRVQLGWSFAF